MKILTIVWVELRNAGRMVYYDDVGFDETCDIYASGDYCDLGRQAALYEFARGLICLDVPYVFGCDVTCSDGAVRGWTLGDRARRRLAVLEQME